jgi:hypothetical protein
MMSKTGEPPSVLSWRRRKDRGHCTKIKEEKEEKLMENMQGTRDWKQNKTQSGYIARARCR